MNTVRGFLHLFCKRMAVPTESGMTLSQSSIALEFHPEFDQQVDQMIERLPCDGLVAEHQRKALGKLKLLTLIFKMKFQLKGSGISPLISNLY